jgi:Acyl-CoA thioesterase C-terminal domain/Acyl-CoA thioesterase N-terminal domain
VYAYFTEVAEDRGYYCYWLRVNIMENWFYERSGTSLLPTELTRGPWHNEHQHGGPPAALLGHTIERFGPDASERSVVRITFDFFRPVPLAPLEVHATLIRSGKTLDRIEAILQHQGETVVRASALRIRRRFIEVSPAASPAPSIPPPEVLAPFTLSFFQHERAYHRAVEVRFAKGQWGDPDVTVWMRTLATLMPDEPMTPFERLLVMVDAESGICPPLNPSHFTFLNPDLSVYVERQFEGEWLGLAVRSGAQPSGVGLAESSLFDARGIFGRAAQSLALATR